MSTNSSARLAILAFSTAAILAAQSYPHAFPRKGASMLFENDRVTVWDATWPIGVEQPVHQHKFDMAYVFLRYGKIKVTSLDGHVSVAAPFEAPRPGYQAKGVTHKEEALGNPGDPERHAIMVDLKDSPAPPFVLKPGMEPAFPREGALDAVDSPRVRIWDYTWTPKKIVPAHVHDKDSVEIFVAPGTLVTKLSGGREVSKTVASGDTRFIPRGQTDTEEAVDGKPRAFVIELK